MGDLAQRRHPFAHRGRQFVQKADVDILPVVATRAGGRGDRVQQSHQMRLGAVVQIPLGATPRFIRRFHDPRS